MHLEWFNVRLEVAIIPVWCREFLHKAHFALLLGSSEKSLSQQMERPTMESKIIIDSRLCIYPSNSLWLWRICVFNNNPLRLSCRLLLMVNALIKTCNINRNGLRYFLMN